MIKYVFDSVKNYLWKTVRIDDIIVRMRALEDNLTTCSKHQLQIMKYLFFLMSVNPKTLQHFNCNS